MGLLFMGLLASDAFATEKTNDLLIKFADPAAVSEFVLMAQSTGSKIESVGDSQWLRVQLSDRQLQTLTLDEIRSHPSVIAVQPNFKIKLLSDYRLKDPAARRKFLARFAELEKGGKVPKPSTMKDNPEIPTRGSGGSGSDPNFSKQWGMRDIGAKNGWKNTSRGREMVVAVIDTGVDYTHEDLVDNLWRNPGEMGRDASGKDKSTNGVDDDSNGYIDDTIGWDMVSHDNKPFDLTVDPLQLIMGGGNPGHGTHCAGNVAARAGNGKGVAGVAPEAKIMSLRFLSEKGEGTTAGAIKAIEYAVKNGAKVLSNSWGSEGEDPKEQEQNLALREAITTAQNAGVLFVAAAGNGHQGVGYDNDTDQNPGYPASYEHENIVSVAALDSSDQLGSFSNWGARTVDLGAPGVKVFSTTVGSQYSDTVIDMLGITVHWDGTSMATPHAAGAAALWWAKHPNATWREVKEALFSSVKPIAALSGKSVSGGKLNVEELMK